MLACEWKREKKARFWLPRRAVLEGKHKIASQIQAFMDPDALFLGFSMPPGTGKALADDTSVLTRQGKQKVVGDEVRPREELVRSFSALDRGDFYEVLCHENQNGLTSQSKENYDTKPLAKLSGGGGSASDHIQLPPKNLCLARTRISPSRRTLSVHG